MKTSFYFLLWILIYPFLGMFHNSEIDRHSFLIALALVWGVQWVLKQLLPQTMAYDRAMQLFPMLEDVYTGNVGAFRKRVVRDAVVETTVAVYFVVTTVVILIPLIKGQADDWFALLVFGFFAFASMGRSVKLVNSARMLRQNPAPETCVEVAENTYGLDYATFYEMRANMSYSQLLPERPRGFRAFEIVSFIIAVAATLIGLYVLVNCILILLFSNAFEYISLGIMFVLYGSLAVCYGIKDVITTAMTMAHKRGVGEKTVDMSRKSGL